MSFRLLWAKKKQSLALDSCKPLPAWALRLGGGRPHAQTFEPLWEIVGAWKCFFYVTDGYKVYPNYIPDEDQIVSKTYMTRVEGENCRLRHYLARLRLHRKTLCYSKSLDMLEHSIRLLIHYLQFWELPLPPRFIP